MAGDTGAAGQIVISVDMTLRALQGAVRTGQSEAGELKVVEGDTKPGVHSMTLLARGGELGGDVVRDGGLLIIVGMA